MTACLCICESFGDARIHHFAFYALAMNLLWLDKRVHIVCVNCSVVESVGFLL